MIHDATRAELVRGKALELGIPEIEAAFIVGQELGELDSDDVLVDQAGAEIRRVEPAEASAIEPSPPVAGAGSTRPRK